MNAVGPIMSCLDAATPAFCFLLWLRERPGQEYVAAVRTTSLMDQENHILAALELRSQFAELFLVVHLLTVDLKHDHPRLQPDIVAKRICLDVRNDDSFAGGNTQPFHLFLRQRMHGDAKFG